MGSDTYQEFGKCEILNKYHHDIITYRIREDYLLGKFLSLCGQFMAVKFT